MRKGTKRGKKEEAKQEDVAMEETTAQGSQFLSDDYYTVLGVNKTATEADIHNAYWKLATKWHPDKNPQRRGLATETFKLIGEAYAVLSDIQ